MSGGWKELDLDGGGLQQANLRLARLLKRRRLAYALLALFPLGFHRDYLEDRRGGWSYRLGSVICIGAAVWVGPAAAGAVALALAAAAVMDLMRVESRLASINKRLRIEVYLGQTAGAPANFRGRHFDAPTDPPVGSDPAAPRTDERTQSFAEQEEALRQIAVLRRRRT